VDGDDAAESRYRVAGEGAAVGFRLVLVRRQPAWVGVLDDRNALLRERSDRAPGRGRVQDVVERPLLSVQLPRTGDAVRLRAERALRGVERCLLVRVLSVPKIETFFVC